MRTSHSMGRQCCSRRRGLANLEAVMTIGVMLPVAGILFFLGVKMASTIYQAIGALVAWPFL